MDMIYWLQSFQGPGLTAFFKGVTFLGNENFYVLILPLIFWMWDRSKSTTLLYVVMLSLFLNVFVKELAAVPRPPEVLRLIEETGFSFPSGHAQGTATFWILLTILTGWRFLPWLSAVLIFLVGLSRVYLGVHYPVDILGGWIFASLVIAVYIFLGPVLTGFLREQSRYRQGLYLSAFFILAALILPRDEALSILGALWGFTLLYLVLEQKLTGKKIPFRYGALTAVVGLVGMVLIKEGLKIILPDSELFRFLRYTAMGGWIAFAAAIFNEKDLTSPKSEKPVS